MSRQFDDPNQPGRKDINGVEWWACDPYPTWYRWDTDPAGNNSTLRTNHAKWADKMDRCEAIHPDDATVKCERSWMHVGQGDPTHRMMRKFEWGFGVEA